MVPHGGSQGPCQTGQKMNESPTGPPRIFPYWNLLWRFLAVADPKEGDALAPHGSEPQACHVTLKMACPTGFPGYPSKTVSAITCNIWLRWEC